MRHKKSFNHLGRKAAHRNAMLSNMASSLIIHKKINTTVAKAKALKSYIEPLITKSKIDSTHSRRVVFSYLQSKESVAELFRDVAVKVANRPGGYTRILKTGNRLGDNAQMCIIELVDYNENYTQAKSETKKTTRRRRSGGAKKKAETTENTQQTVSSNQNQADEKTEVQKQTPANEKAKSKVDAETQNAKKQNAESVEKTDVSANKTEKKTGKADEETAKKE